MNKDRLLSYINITYYILIFILTILSLFYVHFESGLPTSNGELDKIIIYISAITVLINIIFSFSVFRYFNFIAVVHLTPAE